MFKKKDVIRTLFLLLVILVILVTLSQILVVHRRNHRKSKARDSKRIQTAQAMVMRFERNIEAMMKKNYFSTDKHQDYLLALKYSEIIRQQLAELSTVNNGIRNKINVIENSFAPFRERKLRFHDMSEGDTMSTQTKKHYDLHFVDVNSNILEKETNDLSKAEDKASNHGVVNDNDLKEKLLDDKSVRENKLTNRDQSFSDSRQSFIVPYCQETPDGLEGNLRVSEKFAQNENVIEESLTDIQPGGIWKPRSCVARQRIALVLPYRNREKHLKLLLHYLLPVLKRQLLDFRIFVVEQYGNGTFNKGRLMNVGFMEAWKLCNFDCVIFHDVDLLPENDRNMYTCGNHPRHMSIAVDKFRYKLPYLTLVGGVFSIKREQFQQVNGYSNLYWGWGAEDDDMAFRLKTVKLGIERPPATIGRYKMIKHDNRETIPVKMRAYLLKTVRKRYHRDGLNTLDYKVIKVTNTQLYTHILVDVGEPPMEAEDINDMLT
ncbi:Beta-1 [Mactra antiquata]